MQEYLVYLIVSIILYILLFIFPGLTLSKGKPSEPNSVIGFRTKRSLLSKETWTYANTLAGKLILLYGHFYLIINILIFVLMNIFALSETVTIYLFYIQAGLFVLLYFIMYIKVQSKLKSEFDINRDFK